LIAKVAILNGWKPEKNQYHRDLMLPIYGKKKAG
jgi:hypothetical protein